MEKCNKAVICSCLNIPQFIDCIDELLDYFQHFAIQKSAFHEYRKIFRLFMNRSLFWLMVLEVHSLSLSAALAWPLMRVADGQSLQRKAHTERQGVGVFV